MEKLEAEIERARGRFKLPADAEVVSCYEAGRDGFVERLSVVNQEELLSSAVDRFRRAHLPRRLGVVRHRGSG